MNNPNKKPFSESIKMKPEYQVVNSLGLRKLFREYDTICAAGDPSRNCTVWFVIDKDRFFTWTERRTDIFDYQYVIELALNEVGTCVRIHAVERMRKF